MILIFFTIAICNFRNINAQTNTIDSLENWIKNNPKVDSQYIATLHKLSYRYIENNISKSFKYYEKVATLSDSLNFMYGKSLAQINLGILLSNSANYEGSNSAFFKAVEYADACGALRLKAISLNNIGDNFKVLNDFEKCRQYTREAITINTQLGAWRGVAVNYELLQECDLKEKLYTDAKHNLDLGMPFALKANENYIFSQYFLGYGKLQAIAKNIDSANYFFDRALKQASIQNDLQNKYDVYIAKAEYLHNLTPDKKIELLDNALAIARETRYMEGISKAANLLSNVYDSMKNKDSSLSYYRIYRAANDSVFSENNRRNTVIKEADWLIKGKEVENAHLKELSAIQKRDILFKNALLISTAGLLILIIATSIVINKNIQSKKKHTEAELKQRITEMQMQSLRAQMNPHFIFNCLNSIENFIMKNDKIAASEYLNKFSELIRIMLESGRVGLAPFTKNMEGIKLYVELEQLRFDHKFCFKSDIDPQLLNGDYKVPHLMIQPYIENAILHGLSQSEGEKLELKLSAYLENDYIIYIIEDNGIGRERSSKYKLQNRPDHKSIGIELTRERINIFNQQRNGEGGVVITDLYDENNEPIGTRVQIKIKAA
ncbi:MAG TPA: histidine kinase [Hanamia sp.]|nr:histidine kinase [Hanamia sp.]